MIVIIPAYEPDERLIKLIQGIKRETEYQIIVINDGSSIENNYLFDKAKEYATVINHSQNYGKGHAIKTALKYIEDNSLHDGIVIADADGQHTLEDIIKVGNTLIINNPDGLVIGSRLFSGKVPYRSIFGNTVTKYVFQLASGVKVNDTQTGLRAFPSQLIPFLLKIPGNRYDYEMNVLLECAKQKISITEVPIETIYLEKNKSSHFRTIVDSARIYKYILKFSCSSILSFFVDFLIYMVMLWITKEFTLSANILISNIVARVVSSSFNFYVNKKYVFQNKDKLIIAAVKYFSLAVFILTINTALLTFLTHFIIKNKIISKIIVEIILFFVSLIVQNVFVFKKNK